MFQFPLDTATELTDSIFALLFRQMALGGDMVCLSVFPVEDVADG
jgi:hypothetical protein